MDRDSATWEFAIQVQILHGLRIHVVTNYRGTRGGGGGGGGVYGHSTIIAQGTLRCVALRFQFVNALCCACVTQTQG